MPVSKLLIANRGEIACRVIRTARRLGYRTVAVFSEADAHAPHVSLADEAIAIGPAPAAESYLSAKRIIDAAVQSGADAIHPGYGFLSENAAFAEACADAGITFVGPPAPAVDLMGNKRAAKLRMQEAGVPTVPGYSGGDQTDETLAREAERIGFPVMVKAAAGGGGRGMRLVTESRGLLEALGSARAEAESAFGSGELILEKAIVRPRHVEVQVFGDAHGNVIHLGERDCSVQRRHQKVLEESPSPAVDAALRDAMGRAAVEAARAVGYVGAGTVEFLLDASKAYYFLEMNTRLQVEHPVTERVTGLDLVEWQLRVASGEPLPLTQDQVVLAGHAIEARVYAEDPAVGFVPQTGRVLRWQVAPGSDVRVDSGVTEGSVVSPHYDPMIAKVIAHGATRADACRKLAAPLRDTTLFGVVSNKAFLGRLCEHPAFVAGEATTAFLDHEFAGDASLSRAPPDLGELGAAALCVVLGTSRARAWDESLMGWRSGGPVWTTLTLKCGDTEARVRIVRERDSQRLGFRVSREDAEPPEEIHVEVVSHDPETLHLVTEGRRRAVRMLRDGDRIWLDDGDRVRVLEDVTHRPARVQGAAGSGRIVAPLDGSVRRIFVEAGAVVARGETLLVLEAMKMEHPIRADVDGTVSSLSVTEGTQVKTRQLLAEIAPNGEA
jgi:geranyl-CoA carboxylase alpha subunit